MNYFVAGKNYEIWSDGGPKHFKNCYTMRFAFDFFRRNDINARWHYFEPHHGHNLCDSHNGKISQSKRDSDVSNNVISTADALKELIELKLSNTTCIIMDNIDRSDESFRDVDQLKGIQKYRYFEFQLALKGQIRARELTGEGEWCTFY